ncbi:MAG: EamA family transporter [Acidimicrobiales bacterium]
MVGVVGLGMVAAVVYGASDFLGGYAARRLPSLQVTLVAFVAGLATSTAALGVLRSVWSVPAVTFGALSGVAAAVSIWLLYTALAMGPISVVAPLVALLAAAVPVGFGLARGERLPLVGKVALAAVIASAVMLGSSPQGQAGRLRAKALLVGVAAGLATGAYLVALDFTPPTSGAAPIVVAFAAGTVLLAAVSLAGHRIGRGRDTRRRRDRCHSTRASSPTWQAVLSGATQAAADLMVVAGIHTGHLAIMAALIALYPLGTIAPAMAVTGERPSRLQLAGVLLAVAASAALAEAG